MTSKQHTDHSILLIESGKYECMRRGQRSTQATIPGMRRDYKLDEKACGANLKRMDDKRTRRDDLQRIANTSGKMLVWCRKCSGMFTNERFGHPIGAFARPTYPSGAGLGQNYPEPLIWRALWTLPERQGLLHARRLDALMWLPPNWSQPSTWMIGFSSRLLRSCYKLY